MSGNAKLAAAVVVGALILVGLDNSAGEADGWTLVEYRTGSDSEGNPTSIEVCEKDGLVEESVLRVLVDDDPDYRGIETGDPCPSKLWLDEE